MRTGAGQRGNHGERSGLPDDGSPPQPLRRVAGMGEDPLTWAIHLMTWRGVRIGVHAIFPIWALAECAAALPHGAAWVLRAITATTCYMVVGLVRELARAWWAARAGRDVHEIVAWPLGGLTTFGAARCRARALDEMGGVLCTTILVVPLGGFLWALGVSARELAGGIVSPTTFPFTRDPIEVVAFWLFHASVVLTVFNAVVPMSPFDASHAIDRQRAEAESPVDAAGASLRRGLFVAFTLFTGGAVASEERLMALGVLGGFATWIEYRRVMFLHRPLLHTALVEDRAASASVRATQDDDEMPRERVLPQVDDVLAKITLSGLSSLSAEERGLLEEATRRSREERRTDESRKD